MESIKRQSGKLFEKITAEFQALRKGKPEAEVCKEIMQLAKSYTGINVSLEIVRDNDEKADAVLVNQLTAQNTFRTFLIEDFFMQNEKNALEITIDNKNAIIGGNIGKVRMGEIWMGSGTCRHKDSEFPAAVFLHELGHVYTYIAYLTYIGQGAHLIRETIQEIYDESDPAVRKVILVTKAMQLGNLKLTDEEASMIVSAPKENLEVFFAELHGNVRIANDLTSDNYNFREFEQMADMFATKHGGGLAIARWLARDYTHMRQGRIAYYLTRFFLYGGWGEPYNRKILMEVGSFLARYDTEYDRIVTVKNRYMEDMKSAMFKDPELRKQALKEIQEIDAILSKLKRNKHYVLSYFHELTKWGQVIAKEETRMKALETLIFNDLYVRSAKLMK